MRTISPRKPETSERRRTPLWHRRLTASAPLVVPVKPLPARPRVTFLFCAAVVVALDLYTKHLAAGHLGGWRDVPIIDGAARLVLIHNRQSAFGVSLGAYTWQINVALTAVALLLAGSLARPLVSIDRWAPVMLGLIAGAAAGNLYSLIVSPHGVVDFLAINRGNGRELVFNFADVAAAVGLLLTVRTVIAVVRLIQAERRVMLRR